MDDPYTACDADNFIEDLTLWLPIEYGHLFCYFAEHPGVHIYPARTDAVEKFRHV